MKAVNFWKTLFCSALAITAFTACSDNDDNGSNGMPEITVNGGGSVTVARDLTAGETSPVVEVVSNSNWELKFVNEADAQWCTPTKMSGKTGTTSLSFNLSKALAERTAKIKLIASSMFEGIPITREADIVVKQNKGGSTEADTNVSKIRTLLAAMNPGQEKVDVTAEIAAMTITGIVVSNFDGHNFGNDYNIAVQDAVVAENSGLTLNANKFPDLKLSAGSVVSIPLTNAKVNTYGGVIQVSIDNAVAIDVTAGTAPEPTVVTPNELLKYESMLVKIENCMPAAGVANTAWNNTSNKGNANFVTTNGQAFVVRTGTKATFKDDVIPEKSGFLIGVGGQFNGDPQLSPRTAADLAGLNQPIPEVEYKKVTINQVDAAGNYEIAATIVGVHSKGVMFADNAGGKNNFILAFNNDWTTQTSNPYKDNVDFSANVKGAIKDQYGLWQFTAPTITVNSKTSFNLGTPATFDAAAIEAYASAIKADAKASEYKYVKLTGTLSITPETSSGVNYNSYKLTVPGLSDNVVKTVTMAYGFDSYYTGIASGNPVDIEGFALGFDTTKDNLNIMVTKVTKNTSTPTVTITTTPTTFAAASPQQQTLAYTVANTSASQVTFSIEGTNADKFTVVSKTDAQVVVKANGDNTTSAAYTANLVAKVNGETKAVVELKQVGKSSGEDTKGIYTWMANLYEDGSYDSKADFWYFNSKVIPNNGAEVTALRLGKSKFSGVYTTPVLGVTGNKKLSFYAVGWTGAASTVYVRVNGGGSVSGSPVSVEANAGYTGNPPFKMTLTDSDYYTMELKDLTASSTLTISTSPDFAGASDSANKSRAAIIGLQIY